MSQSLPGAEAGAKSRPGGFWLLPFLRCPRAASGGRSGRSPPPHLKRGTGRGGECGEQPHSQQGLWGSREHPRAFLCCLTPTLPLHSLGLPMALTASGSPEMVCLGKSLEMKISFKKKSFQIYKVCVKGRCLYLRGCPWIREVKMVRGLSPANTTVGRVVPAPPGHLAVQAVAAGSRHRRGN